MMFGSGVMRSVGRFRRDARGMAAVEFAMIVPLMLALFFGTIEVSEGVAVDRKLTLAARTISDLISQGVKATDADINNAFKMGAAILTPYSATPLQQRISAIDIDDKGNAKVVWSEASNMQPLKDAVSVPPNLIVNNTQLILGEVIYTYKPAVAFFMGKSGITLTDSTYTRPRQSVKVERVVDAGS
jgi:Flp pilus assembly protein TadG